MCLWLMRQTASSRWRGVLAERRAAHFLKRQGLRLVQRNFSCKTGEIDLIMTDGDQLVVVEVRYRQSATFGSATDSIGRAKQARIIAATRYFLRKFPQYQHYALRFDTVGFDGGIRAQHIRWERDAFRSPLSHY